MRSATTFESDTRMHEQSDDQLKQVRADIDAIDEQIQA
jgi:hypothetical protein